MSDHTLVTVEQGGRLTARCACGWVFDGADSLNQIEDAHARHLRDSA